jgi:hypothetical protein
MAQEISNCGSHVKHFPRRHDSKKQTRECDGICYGPHVITDGNKSKDVRHICNICTHYWTGPIP